VTEDWRSRASCRKSDVKDFYAHEKEVRKPVPEHVKALCGQCPVGDDCFEYAILYEDYGFWAGTTAKERREMRRQVGLKIRRVEVRLRPQQNDGK